MTITCQQNRKIVALFLAFLMLPHAGAQYGRPNGPERRVANPLRDDIQLGLEIATMIVNTVGLCENEEWEARIQSIGYRIANVTGDRERLFNFQILDLPEPNAMALPGGFLFITRGMFDLGITDDELGHLIGHEVAHVDREHFTRAMKVNTILSVLQTALMAGILFGIPGAYGNQQVEVADDPGQKTWSVGMSGKGALLQGSSLFGGVVRALFERGYSRKLEFEADDMGSRLAQMAGFDPAGGPGLLARLGEHSYEGYGYSYWRTHPFFEDRIARAYARADRQTQAREIPDDTAYRQDLALQTLKALDRVPNEHQARYLSRAALQAEPDRIVSLPLAFEMVRFKDTLEQREHPLKRRYGSILAGYDSLLAHANRAAPGWPDLKAAERARHALADDIAGLLDDYTEVLGADDSSTDFLQGFLSNYPTHERAPEATCLLALHYQLSQRPAHSIEVLDTFLTDQGEGIWADSARTILAAAISELEDLTACADLIEAPLLTTPALIAAAHARMDSLIAEDIPLKMGSEFLRGHPDGPWSAQVRAKLWNRANELHEDGRIQEGLHRYQDALNAYFAILALAPDSPAADLADGSIRRIQMLEAINSGAGP